jgi:hypothetical protein
MLMEFLSEDDEKSKHIIEGIILKCHLYLI